MTETIGGRPRYDLHCHSRHSYDSVMSPKAVLAAARRRGLSGIAITDHDSVAGGLEAAALAPSDLLVIVGSEVSTTAGDIVGLFLKEDVRTRDPLEALEAIEAQGGIAILPHPLHGHRGLHNGVLDRVVGYEVLNGRSGRFDPVTSPPKYGSWSSLVGRTAVGGSDAHLLREVGRCWTEIEGPATPDNVKSKLRAGDVIAAGIPASSATGFWLSQGIKFLKTGDLRMLGGLVRRVTRRVALQGVPFR